MFSEKRRGHWGSIVKSIIRTLKGWALILIFIILKPQNNTVYDIAFFLGILLVVTVGAVWTYLRTTFYINENNLIYEKNGINKTRIEIPIDKINTIDEEVTIVDRILNSCSLKIDNGVRNIDKGGEAIKLQLTIEDARKLQKYVTEKRKESALDNKHISKNTEESYEVKGDILKNLEDNITTVKSPSIDKEKIVYKKVISFKEMIIYGLTKKKLFGVIGFLITAGLFIGEIAENMDTNFFTEVLNYTEGTTAKMMETKLTILFFITIVLLGVFIAISMIAVVYEAIRLYNFTIECDNNKVHIRYGLFKVKNYTIALNKIHAINIKQSILQQIFKLYYVEGTIVGYGDEEKEKAILFPIIKKEELNEIIKIIIPNYKEPEKINKVNNTIIKIDMFCTNIGIVVGGIIVSLLCDITSSDSRFIVMWLIGIIIIINIIFILMYRRVSIASTEDVVEVCNGKLSKNRDIIKQSSVQSIKMTQGLIKRKLDVVNISIDVYATNIGIPKIAYGINKSAYNEIIENLDI